MSIWYAYRNISKAGAVKPYQGICPPYYDLKGTSWYDILTKNIPDIRNKVLDLLSRQSIHAKEYYNTSLVGAGKWESIPFLVWNIPKRSLKEEGKEVYSYFKDIPGLVSLSVSVLNAGTHVRPHNGDTDATYRIHIPIVIPAGLPECGIKVNAITKAWAENELIAFCDAHMHEAWNNSKQTRVVLIADVVRPELLSQHKIICSKVLSWLLLQKVAGTGIMRAMPFILKAPLLLLLMTTARPFFGLLQRRQM
jgi:aspartyl/asparaginyl beta-hydroxylase (cupin superfamily)